MTLTPGYYKTRDGRKARVLCVDAPGEYPCVGYIVENRNTKPISWMLDGDYRNEPYTHGLDLIEPWTEPKPKKTITLRRALRKTATGDYWVSGPSTDTLGAHVHDHGFIRWLDEEPMTVEVDE